MCIFRNKVPFLWLKTYLHCSVLIRKNSLPPPSVGPLHSDSLYDISASKEGFVLTPVEGKTGDFKAFALAGVTFEVR